MKKFYFASLKMLTLFIFLLTACSPKPDAQSDKTTNVTSATQAVSTEELQKVTTSSVAAYDESITNTAETENKMPDENIHYTTEFVPGYTPDSNESEILRPGDYTNEDVSNTDNMIVSTFEPTQEISEPTLPFAEGEPIELPFVPVA